MSGRRPIASLLKVIHGTARPSELKADRPKIDALPVVPPGVILSADERAMWGWLMEHVALPGLHGTGDGGSFVKIVKLWARVCEADRRCSQFGLVMKNDQGKPELQPYARLSRDLWKQLGIAFAEVGATPAGRVRIAGSYRRETIDTPSAWDEID